MGKNILDLKTLSESIKEKADNILATQEINGLMSLNDKKKLDNIEEGVTNYIHPTTHDASMISVKDVDEIFEGTNVESVLKELYYKVPESSNVDNEVINKLQQQINTLSAKQLEILIYLNIANNSDADSAGYWFDALTSDENILSISGLRLDTDRNRIMGSEGTVVFNPINIPFNSNSFKYIHELDDNFIESIMTTSFELGTTELVLDKFSYEIK